MPRIKEFRERAGYSQAETARQLKIDRSLINKFENYVVLPIPADAQKICNFWNCKLHDLYNQNEILSFKSKNIKCAQVQNGVCTLKNVNSRVNTYNFCVRVHRDDFPLLTKNTLAECGYNSLREFLWQAYKVLQKRYNKIKKEASSLNDEKPQSA